jgi:hypothetical protein
VEKHEHDVQTFWSCGPGTAWAVPEVTGPGDPPPIEASLSLGGLRKRVIARLGVSPQAFE